ncbi:hypothetical protein B0T22DRAFT_517436 [Podospora appendiculata]|uniref:Transporter n=1 Tax=Podospora appendiculata TaxID=314037 RepID=A0AAE1CAB9_9PEZI|nr:hypothetical protein B0T22DRAFT_517436 [Podospora appendiculata]
MIGSLPAIFHPRVTWLSAIFTFIGGGPAVFHAMIFTIADDVVSEKQRSATFFYLAAAVIVGELLASPLTLSKKAAQDDLTEGGDDPPPAVVKSDNTWLVMFHHARTEAARLGRAAVGFAWRNWQVAALLFTFLLTTLGRFAQELLLHLLLSIRAFSNLVLFTALLPAASYMLVQNAQLLTLGAFAIGLAEKSGLIASIGALAAGPLLAWTFRTGMDWEGAWIGLPYIAADVLFLMAAVTTGFVRLSSLEKRRAVCE